MPAQRLNHVHIAVSDLDRSIAFYTGAFGAREAYRDQENGEILVFLMIGDGDVLTLNSGSSRTPGDMGGIHHFGFHAPGNIDDAVAAVEQHGGSLIERAHWEPEHVAYVRDPDGYVIEIDARAG